MQIIPQISKDFQKIVDFINTVKYKMAACDQCNADPGEPCRPYCIAQAAHDNEIEDSQ
jgi:hypothetical protein